VWGALTLVGFGLLVTFQSPDRRGLGAWSAGPVIGLLAWAIVLYCGASALWRLYRASFLANLASEGISPSQYRQRLRCPICGFATGADWDFTLIECPTCRRLYHERCWEDHGRQCANPRCPASPLFVSGGTPQPPVEIALQPSAGPAVAGSVSKTCPYCQSAILLQQDPFVCPTCKTPHHRECWRENGGCTTYGCRNAPSH
jgi:hypothetical protein